MAVKSKKKEEEKHGTDLLENPDALADKLSQTEELIEKNKGLVYGISIAVILISAGIFGFRYYQSTQNEQAHSEMFQAIYYFEADSLNLALNGDGNNLGFVDIIEDYGMTPAANLANFYAGAAYLKQGKFKLAILYLEDFSSDDLLVQARAYSMIGDAHMELEDYNSAASYYNQAADYKANKFFTPQYLMKAGLAYEKANKTTEAINAYQTIIDKYVGSSEYQNARKFKARLTKAS